MVAVQADKIINVVASATSMSAARNSRGIIFCAVIRRNAVHQVTPISALGNQWCAGAAPILTIRPRITNTHAKLIGV